MHIIIPFVRIHIGLKNVFFFLFAISLKPENKRNKADTITLKSTRHFYFIYLLMDKQAFADG